MNRLNKEYIEVLMQDKKASDIFWELEARLKADKRKPGVIIEMKRSSMLHNIVNLINDGVITEEDLSGFSDDLREVVQMMICSRI